MPYTSHITPSRINARILYITPGARDQLSNGQIKIHLPSGLALDGEVRPGQTPPCQVVNCLALYLDNPNCPKLPLRDGDYVDYEIRDGNLHVVAIRRIEGGVSPAPSAPAPPDNIPRTTRMRARYELDADTPYWQFDALPPLPGYLKENEIRIRNLGDQQLPPWSNRYHNIPGVLMDSLRTSFPERTISRDGLVRLYSQWTDPALTLIATMVWGGIRETNLKPLLQESENILSEKMRAIRNRVRAGRFDDAFRACSIGGSLALSGVGVSYFTKIFFFVGQASPVLQPAPLIFDKWTGHALFALGRQSCQHIPWNDYFNIEPLNRDDPVAFNRDGEKPLKLYRLYVAWMNQWASQLNVSAAKLEQFLFGISRKTSAGKSPDNARNQLIKLAKTPDGSKSSVA